MSMLPGRTGCPLRLLAWTLKVLILTSKLCFTGSEEIRGCFWNWGSELRMMVYIDRLGKRCKIWRSEQFWTTRPTSPSRQSKRRSSASYDFLTPASSSVPFFGLKENSMLLCIKQDSVPADFLKWKLTSENMPHVVCRSLWDA